MNGTRPTLRFWNDRRAVALCVLLAIAVRGAVVWWQSAELTIDRDAYLGLARELATGNGYVTPGSDHPTAYRPPLYPLVIAGLMRVGGGPLALGTLQILFGAGTVYFTWHVGQALSLGRISLLAALLIAVDPLLVWYTVQPMTEVFCAFLAASLLAVAVGGWQSAFNPQQPVPSPESPISSTQNSELCTQHSYPSSLNRPLLLGVLFGLCVLCRPTFWLFGALVATWWIVRRYLSRWKSQHADSPLLPLHRNGRSAVLVCLAVGLTVAPWVVRNWLVFGEPILTTTHGGYTLLLGNNPVFYREVVGRPWGTTWQLESLGRWQAHIETELHAQLGPAVSEPQRDRWMAQRAWQNIASEPRTFLRACLLRLRRFWGFAPEGEAAAGLPGVARVGVFLFYLAETLLMLCGLLSIWRRRDSRWLPLLLLIAAFLAAHTIYWSNARMRSPVLPAIALVSAAGAGFLGTRWNHG